MYESGLTSGALYIPARTGATCFDALRRNSFALAERQQSIKTFTAPRLLGNSSFELEAGALALLRTRTHALGRRLRCISEFSTAQKTKLSPAANVSLTDI